MKITSNKDMFEFQARISSPEILRRMAENGERKIQGNAVKSRDATSLEDLGISKDRASRAMQLADVPQDQFDAPDISQSKAWGKSMSRILAFRAAHTWKSIIVSIRCRISFADIR